MASVIGATGLPIFQYWHSPEIPAEVADLTTTFRDQNPALRHVVLCEEQATEFIARRFTSREVDAFRACAVPAMQADYFRYCAALAAGGVCADADIRCQRPLRDLIASTDRGALFWRAGEEVVNAFFLFRSPGHPLLRLALDMATRSIEDRIVEDVWAVTGPWIFTALVGLHRFGSVDAMLREAAGLKDVRPPVLRKVARLRAMEPAWSHLLQGIDAHERIAEAFDGVRMLPWREQLDPNFEHVTGLSFKEDEGHWARWQRKSTIFALDGAGRDEAERLESLATRIRERIGPSPVLADHPLVSIVVPNRDGAPHLRRLLTGLLERTEYPRLELIVVDNGSRDDSLDLLHSVEAPFPISVLANAHNESFSDACNQGAEVAEGELLLFLNNDVEPFEPGWLGELVGCLLGTGAGAVAATLICPDEEHARSFEHGYGVQHRGLRFEEEEEDGRLAPRLRGWEEDPLDPALGQDVECDAVAAACLLLAAATYREVGGFSPGYSYGCEDVDLCLKLRASGSPVTCSGRSIAVHHPASTRRAIPFEEARRAKLANRRLLWERWGPRLRWDYAPRA
jgi:GT2 family glycosyltransferase